MRKPKYFPKLCKFISLRHSKTPEFWYFCIMRGLSLFLLIFTQVLKGFSHHIVGGEIYYDYAGGGNYNITLKVYRDCSLAVPVPFDAPARITIYDGTGNLYDSLDLTFPGSNLVPATINNPCFTAPTGICVDFAVYTGSVKLPLRTGGYYIIYQRCCRNSSILNISNPSNTGDSYVEHIPGPEMVAVNSSPRFITYPPLFICDGIDINFNNTGSDPDGDSLVYELCDPFTGLDPCCPILLLSTPNTSISGCVNPPSSGICPTLASPPPYPTVTFVAPYSGSYPLSSNPPIQINPQTGHISGTPDITGQWVVGVCVREYRHGVLIGTHLRDFQFNVTQCPNLIVSAIQQQIQFCTGLTVNFANLSSGGIGYTWDFGDNANLGDTSNLSNVSYTYPDTGTYIVTLINKGPFPTCNDTSKKSFHVLPLLNPNILQPGPQCIIGNLFNFSVGGQFPNYTTFNWNFTSAATPTFSNLQNPTGIHFNQTGTIVVTLTAHEYSCIKSVTDSIIIYPLTSAHFHLDSAKGCSPVKVSFTDSSQFGTGAIFSWNFGDGSTSNLENPTHIYLDSGHFSVTLAVTTTLGCVGTSTFSASNLVTVFPGPEAGFYVNPKHTTIYYNTIRIIDTSRNTNSLTLNMGDGTVLNYFPPNYSYEGSGNFQITEIALSSNGCSDTAVCTVLIDPDWTLYIPNSFSPNGDEINEVFRCQGVDIATFRMVIYDRWGNKILEATDIHSGWDGTFHGKQCEQDVYVYKVEYSNSIDYLPKKITGQIILIR